MVAGTRRSSFFGPTSTYYLPCYIVVATTTFLATSGLHQLWPLLLPSLVVVVDTTSFLGGTKPTIQISVGLAVDAYSTHSHWRTVTAIQGLNTWVAELGIQKIQTQRLAAVGFVLNLQGASSHPDSLKEGLCPLRPMTFTFGHHWNIGAFGHWNI